MLMKAARARSSSKAARIKTQPRVTPPLRPSAWLCAWPWTTTKNRKKPKHKLNSYRANTFHSTAKTMSDDLPSLVSSPPQPPPPVTRFALPEGAVNGGGEPSAGSSRHSARFYARRLSQAVTVLPNAAHHLHIPQQVKNIEVFENGISYLIYITSPVNVAMVTIGTTTSTSHTLTLA